VLIGRALRLEANLAAVTARAAEPETPNRKDRTLRVPLVGNSYTFYNELPKRLRNAPE